MLIEYDDDKILVRTRTTPAMLAVVRRLEGRRKWLKEGGLEALYTRNNLEILLSIPGAEAKFVGRRAEGAEDWSNMAPMAGIPYEPKTTPYDHQKEAGEKMEPWPQFALFMEQGTGKTKTSIDRVGRVFVAGKVDAAIIVAKAGVHRQWIESELPTHLGVPWFGWHYTARKMVASDQNEPNSERQIAIMTISFDSLRTEKGFQEAESFMRAFKGRVFIIGDETQKIKDYRSKSHDAMERLKALQTVPYRMILTGTPIAKDLTDEWAQLRWLNPDIIGIKYVTAFRREYCIMGGFEGRQVIAHKNVDKFKALTAPISYRATKDQLGILPKSYKEWVFDLTITQKKLMRELKDNFKACINDTNITIKEAVHWVLKAQQLTNGFIVDADGKSHEIMDWRKNPRVMALREYLDAQDGEQVIIWARFKMDVDLIAAMLTERKISMVEYVGRTSQNERAENVQKFLSGDAQVFLSNPQSGGTGLNLQKGGCTRAVYYSNSFNFVDREQSEDRIHRIGTTGNCVYTDLIAKGGVDRRILSNLKGKKGLSEMVLGDVQSIFEEDGWGL